MLVFIHVIIPICYNKLLLFLQGKHDGSEVVTLTSEPNITLDSLDRRDTGIYECSAENNQGPKASSSISVRVTCKYS